MRMLAPKVRINTANPNVITLIEPARERFHSPPNLGMSLKSSRRPSPIRFANLTGFPDLVVPAGFTGNRLPVGVSFLGRPFSEPRLLALGYAFEQITQARRLPVHTPALSADADSPQP